MPGAREEYARLGWLLKEGKISDDEPCKVILPKIEARKRVVNKEGRTRLTVQLDTTETYSEFNYQFGRYKELTGNPQVAYQLMLDVLKALSDEAIQRLARGHSEG